MSHPSRAGIHARLLLTALFWGGTWVAARIVVQEVTPFSAAFVRFLIALVATIALVWREQGRVPVLRPAQWLWPLAMGAIGIFAYNYFFLNGLRHIAAGRGALVVALNPAVAALVAWRLGQEKMTPARALGVLLALAGCVLVVSNGRPQALLAGEVGVGELLIVGCVVCWTLYTFIARLAMRTLSASTTNLYACLTGCAMLGVAAAGEGFFTHWPAYSLTVWGAILFLALFGTTLGYLWFTVGVRELGAARASNYINLVPIFGVLLGALLLGERLDPFVLVGGAVTIAGVVLTNRPSPAATRITPRCG